MREKSTASRELALGDSLLQYRFRRSPRAKHLRVWVDAHGVLVVAPPRASERAVQRFLQAEREWLRRKIETHRALQAEQDRQREARLGRLLWEGRWIPLIPQPDSGLRPRFFLQPDRLVFSPGKEAADRVATALLRWLKARARELLPMAMEPWSRAMRLLPENLKVRELKSRWGSCIGRRTVVLNARLILVPPEVRDYILIHELAHLKYMSHGPRFWALVERYCPRYAEHRLWLRQRAWEVQWPAAEDVRAALAAGKDRCEDLAVLR